MAAITTGITVLKASQPDSGEQWALLKVSNVDTADTIDVAAISGLYAFKKLKNGTFLVEGALATVGTVSWAGTVGTLTCATMADDTILLLLQGA